MSLSSRERGIAWYVDPIPSELQSSADDRSRLALTRACAAPVPGQRQARLGRGALWRPLAPHCGHSVLACTGQQRTILAR